MARFPSVAPRANPLRENPAGLLIGGLLALAAAGGAGWYFLGKGKGKGGQGKDIKPEELDQALWNQLDQQRKDAILRAEFTMGAMMGWERAKFIDAKNRLMKQYLNPEVLSLDYYKWEKKTVEATGDLKRDQNPHKKNVSMAEADALVASGKYQWGDAVFKPPHPYGWERISAVNYPDYDRKKARAAWRRTHGK